MTQLASSSWPVILGLVLATLIWGGSFTVLKFVLANYDPFLVTFSRLVVATLVFLLSKDYLGPFPYRQGDWKLLALMALFEPFLYFILEIHALRLTSSAAAATVIALLPMAVAVTAYYGLNEQLTPRLWKGLIIALAGTVLLTWSGRETVLAPHPLLGNDLVIV